MYMPFLRVSSTQVHAEAIFLRLFRVFFYDSIVYAVPFKHDWILMNGLFSSLNARWLCKLLWKHIYFLIGEIHKQTNTRCSHIHKRANTTTRFWPKYILTPLPFSLVFNHFAHFFFFCHQKRKNFPLPRSMSMPLMYSVFYASTWIMENKHHNFFLKKYT